ncbi:MAG: 50S ribosomal protein L23 [Chlamydiia bacterium]|nr:50S ribosomal protein L23 [Chlamydiia bacterium]
MTKSQHIDKILSVHQTEKSAMLFNLKESESNACVRKFKSAKYVFLVRRDANKHEIREAIESLYEGQNIKIEKINTIHKKPCKRRSRGRIVHKSGMKKAIVTLREGCSIEMES